MICLSVLQCDAQTGLTASPLKFVQSISLPGVEGRIDHFDIDLKGQRLFVSALGNDTLEAIDLKTGKLIQSIDGCSEPQGVVYVPDLNRIFVANGGAGTVNVLDGTSFKLLKRLGGMSDADDARYDARAGLVYVAYGDGALAVIRAATAEKIASIKLDAHPEAFELEPNGNRIFINVPDAREIEVADRRQQAVVAKWPTERFRGNFPMALDEKDRRLFVGCRRPARLVVFDIAAGRQLTDLPLSGDCDDLFYDAARRRIYASCGEGFVEVISQQSADSYAEREKVPTASGARTSLFIPERNLLYVAVPHRGDQPAEILVYKVEL